MNEITASLISALLGLVSVLQSSAATTTPIPLQNVPAEQPEQVEQHTAESAVPAVPFYSQFYNISDPAWKKLGCGVASLAMLIDFYTKQEVNVDTLLQEGIDSGAYLSNAGWTHQGLVNLAGEHGLSGAPRDFSSLTMESAYANLEEALQTGPVIASVYYTFTPGHPIPHLVVINGIEGDTVHYNDPAESNSNGTISIEDFKPAWKKRFIEIRPQV